MTESVRTFRVAPGDGGRLDRYLAEQGPDLSRSRWQSLIDGGGVSVDGQPATKGGLAVEPGQLIVVQLPPPHKSTLTAERLPLDVVYQDDDLLIINKPAGLVVHPAPGHDSGTLVNAVLGLDPGIEGLAGEGRPGIVHRLDKDTSGLLVIARNDKAHRWLQAQFKDRKVEKYYTGLVDGKPPTPTGRIEADIGRDPRDRKRMAILRTGRRREAITEYRTIEEFPRHTLLDIRPLTGRTHQIRLHCSFLGCPIVGDAVYGRKPGTPGPGRQFLHAAKLVILLPGRHSPSAFEAPLPPDLQRFLNALRSTV